MRIMNNTMFQLMYMSIVLSIHMMLYQVPRTVPSILIVQSIVSTVS